MKTCVFCLFDECRYGAALVAVAIDDDAWHNRPTARLRLYEFLHAWDAHWTRHENSEWAHVRSGWVNVDANTITNGMGPRLVRLSRNGTSDVINERSWLDEVVGAFVDPDRFPPSTMPSFGPVPAPSSAPTHPPELVSAIHGQNSSSSHDSGNGRVGVVEPRLSLTPIISQMERMHTE
jgi:hypothetical protein